MKALMKQGVIQDFLNLPGIAGIALMDRQSRPYFHGLDRSLNFQQKEALAQGILQVIETIPEGFESFEFQFTEQKVHIYKLDRGLILLVLTRNQLVDSNYPAAIETLKHTLQSEIIGTIATLRQAAGSSTLSGLSYRKSPLSSPLPALDPETLSVHSPTARKFTLAEVISTLNHLSQFTSQYLGTHVIVNYWKSTRPSGMWLMQFQVDRSAQFSLHEARTEALEQVLTLEQRQWLQTWVAAFIQRCAVVIRDFPAIVEQRALDERQKTLLLGKK
jgi:hypothetical protein